MFSLTYESTSWLILSNWASSTSIVDIWQWPSKACRSNINEFPIPGQFWSRHWWDRCIWWSVWLWVFSGTLRLGCDATIYVITCNRNWKIIIMSNSFLANWFSKCCIKYFCTINICSLTKKMLLYFNLLKLKSEDVFSDSQCLKQYIS